MLLSLQIEHPEPIELQKTQVPVVDMVKLTAQTLQKLLTIQLIQEGIRQERHPPPDINE